MFIYSFSVHIAPKSLLFYKILHFYAINFTVVLKPAPFFKFSI